MSFRPRALVCALIGFALAAPACRPSVTDAPPGGTPVSVSAAPTPPDAAIIDANVPAFDQGETMTMTPIGAWGVEVAVPPDATSEHDAPNHRHWITIPGAGMTLNLFDWPAPTFADALRSWNADQNLETFGEGVTEHGAFYALRSFEVRDGILAGGTHFHFWIRVSRVYTILPVDSGHHVQCIGYIERGVEADDATLAAVARICTSLRLAR